MSLHTLRKNPTITNRQLHRFVRWQRTSYKINIPTIIINAYKHLITHYKTFQTVSIFWHTMTRGQSAGTILQSALTWRHLSSWLPADSKLIVFAVIAPSFNLFTNCPPFHARPISEIRLGCYCTIPYLFVPFGRIFDVLICL